MRFPRVHAPAACTVGIVLFVVLAVSVAFAQTDGSIETDDDALFGSSDTLFDTPLVTEIQQTETDIPSTLLTSETVTVGGRYSMSLQGGVGWNDIATMMDTITTPDTTTMTTALGTQIYLDARPDEDFRVFGKLTATYPFATDTSRELSDVFHVDELFSDFNWNDTVFFRGGKQTMNWGVGYFYSPADLLSISEVDPEDPEADREGPVALKANIPLGVDNVYVYILPQYAEEPLDTGLAAKGEVVLGGTEIRGGFIYQRDIPPAGMITATASIRDADLFAEAVLSYGSARTFIRESVSAPFGIETYTRADEFFPSATAGLRYSYSPEEARSSVTVVAQYLYNGEGYADPSILGDNQGAVGVLLGGGDLSLTDLQNSGRHYSAMQFSWSDILGSGVTTGVFWMENYSDLSARVTPSVSVTVLDRVSLSLQFPMTFGDTGDELAPNGSTFSASLGVGIGNGSF